MTREFSGSVVLPTKIAVTLECLGREIEGTTGDESFTLTFPRLEGENDLLRPPDFHEPQWLDDDEEDDGKRVWGVVNRQLGVAVITGLAIFVKTTALPNRTEPDVTASYAQEVFPAAFAQWVDRVSTILELWSGQGVQRFQGSRSVGPIIELFDHNRDVSYKTETVEASARALASKTDQNWRFLSLVDWESAARLVSTDNALDDVWLMFNHAQKMAQTEQRFAVIEACTAVEVAVGRRVAESLYGYSTDAQEQVLTNAGGVVGLVRLYDKLSDRTGYGKRPDYSNDLAHLRNNVAHRGKLPTDAEVGRALAAARHILDEVCPLPSPTSASD